MGGTNEILSKLSHVPTYLPTHLAALFQLLSFFLLAEFLVFSNVLYTTV